MNRLAFLAAAAVLAGCASTAGEIPESRTERRPVQVDIPGTSTTTLELSRDAAIATQAVAAPPERAWALLQRVYAEMEIPVTDTDAGVRILSSGSQRLRRVGGRAVSAWFQCTGAYENVAASGDVFVTVRTQLLPAEGGGTEARTEVGAWARSRSGSRVQCASNGLLERDIGDRLRAAATDPS